MLCLSFHIGFESKSVWPMSLLCCRRAPRIPESRHWYLREHVLLRLSLIILCYYRNGTLLFDSYSNLCILSFSVPSCILASCFFVFVYAVLSPHSDFGKRFACFSLGFLEMGVRVAMFGDPVISSGVNFVPVRSSLI